MTTAPIATVVALMQTLPEAEQQQLVEQIKRYLAEMHDEDRWDALVETTRPKLKAAARQARQDIAAGLAQPMNLADL